MSAQSRGAAQESKMVTPSRRAVSRIVGGQALILDANQDEIRQLNTVGSFLWSLILESPHQELSLLEKMMDEFEVTREVASADLQSFLEELESLGLIERA